MAIKPIRKKPAFSKMTIAVTLSLHLSIPLAVSPVLAGSPRSKDESLGTPLGTPLGTLSVYQNSTAMSFDDVAVRCLTEAHQILLGKKNISEDSLPIEKVQLTAESLKWPSLNFPAVFGQLLSVSKIASPLIKHVINSIPTETDEGQESFFNLANKIFHLRKALFSRFAVNRLNQEEIHRNAYLLQLLGEEVLHIGNNLKGGKHQSRFLMSFKTAEKESRSAEVIKDLVVENGDILLSKATGSLSSWFIAQSSLRPQFFSHSTPAYIDGDKALSPEAFIEDGLKIRKLHLEEPAQEHNDQADNENLDGSSLVKTRLFVYRGKQSLANKLSNGIDQLIHQLKDSVKEKDVNWDSAENKLPTLLPYDFDFNMEDTSKVSCVETSMMAANLGGATKDQLPYSTTVLNRFKPELFDLQTKILGIIDPKKPIGAPGDLELNASYELTGMAINLEKLQQDRIEFSIIRSLLRNLKANQDGFGRLVSSIANLGNEKLDVKTKNKVASILANNSKIKSENKLKLQKLLEQIPADATLKQVMFFGILNQALGPKIRDTVMAADHQSGDSLSHEELIAVADKSLQSFIREDLQTWMGMLQKLTAKK